MKRFVSALALALVACGAGGPPEARTAASGSSHGRPAPLTEPRDEGARLGIEYVAIPVAWVEKYVPASPADVRAWGEVPENRAKVKTDLRQVLVRFEKNAAEADVAAARKKAEAIVVRAGKGEDFAKIAESASEDPGSAPRGGSLGTDASTFADDLRKAFDALGPGDTAKTPLRTSAGFHVLHKDAPSEDQLTAAYKKAKAPDVARKLADDLLARLRTPDSARAAIAAAVEATLGESAVADAERPQPALAPREDVGSIHLLQDLRDGLVDFAKTARAGQVLDAPLGRKRILVVARAISSK